MRIYWKMVVQVLMVLSLLVELRVLKTLALYPDQLPLLQAAEVTVMVVVLVQTILLMALTATIKEG